MIDMKHAYRKRLDEMVDQFLRGARGFEEFQRAYSACYADENADRDFSATEVEYYGAIHEKAEWTASAPPLEERELGWMDVGDFTRWLRSHTTSPPPSV